MGGLQSFENRLEQMISGVFARTFRSAVQPVEIAAALQREVDNSAQILSRDRRLVPNSFLVELAPPTSSGWRRTTTPSRGAHRDAPRARRVAVLRLHRPGQDRLRRGRRPDHRPVPGAQRGARPRSPTNATEHEVRPRQVSSRSTAPATRSTRPASWSAAATTPTCGSTTPASAAGTSSSGSPGHRERGGDPQLSVHDLGSTNGMLVNGTKVQRGHPGRRRHDPDRQHDHDRALLPDEAVGERCLS